MTPCPGGLLEWDEAHEILGAEHLVQHVPHEVHVLVADMDEDRARLGQQFAGDDEAVAQVAEVRVDAELPGVAEGSDLLGLAGGVLGLAVLHVALPRGDLPVAAELDPVGRIEVDRLDLALEAVLLGEGAHHEERVAEDHPVRPLHGMPVEVDPLLERHPVEVAGEEVELHPRCSERTRLARRASLSVVWLGGRGCRPLPTCAVPNASGNKDPAIGEERCRGRRASPHEEPGRAEAPGVSRRDQKIRLGVGRRYLRPRRRQPG